MRLERSSNSTFVLFVPFVVLILPPPVDYVLSGEHLFLPIGKETVDPKSTMEDASAAIPARWLRRRRRFVPSRDPMSTVAANAWQCC